MRPASRRLWRGAILLGVVMIATVAGPAAGEQASQPDSPAAGSLATGSFHSCALNASTVRCWGYGANGQLGYGNRRSIGDDEAPRSAGLVDLDPLPGVGSTRAIAGGSLHNCALLEDGSVRCWGFGGNGRLGYGNTDTIGDSETPAAVGPVDLDPGASTGTAKAISAGNGHTCAILESGPVRCWGFNLDGRLGYGNTEAIGDTETPGSAGPVDLDPGPGSGTAKAISAGGFHTCAILDSGEVRCWGFGGGGRLGYGNIDNVGREGSTPAMVRPVDLDPGPGSGTAKAISAGNGHTCAIIDSGAVRCWGSNASGQLGRGDTRNIGDDETPASVPTVDLDGHTAKAIRAGGEHTCAILDDDSLRCWGYNGFGQLGYGNTTDVGENEPAALAGPVDLAPGAGFGTAKAVDAAGLHTCARLADDSIRCWGRGQAGRLGYCNERNIGDTELPSAAGPVDLGAGGARCAAIGSAAPPPTTGGGSRYALDTGLAAEAARRRSYRSCAAKVARHARREVRRAARLSGLRRARALRHARRHRRSLKRRCVRQFGRTPGRVTGLTARGISSRRIELNFNAPGSDGSKPPAARTYVVKQSRRPIRSSRAFRRARSLCRGKCRYTITLVGSNLKLTVTGLRRRTRYYFSVAARDNVSGRSGPRSQTASARTR